MFLEVGELLSGVLPLFSLPGGFNAVEGMGRGFFLVGGEFLLPGFFPGCFLGLAATRHQALVFFTRAGLGVALVVALRPCCLSFACACVCFCWWYWMIHWRRRWRARASWLLDVPSEMPSFCAISRCE